MAKRSAPARAEFTRLPPGRSPWPFIVLLLALLAALGTTGYAYYQGQKAIAEEAFHEQLGIIGDLKAQEVARWLKERRGDANTLLHRGFGSVLETFIADPTAPRLRQKTLEWMASLTHHYDYSNVVLVNAGGQPLLATDPLAAVTLLEQTHAFIEQALRTQQVVFSDLYGDDTARLDFIVPLLTEHRGDASSIGALLLQVDLDALLFPMIQTWPTPSTTAEALLVRREETGILFLGKLRHYQHAGPAPLRLYSIDSLLATTVPWDKEGEIQGTDYRNVEVLAATRQVPGSPWYLIVKIDLREVEAPVWRSTIRTLAIIVLMILLVSFSIRLIGRRQTVALLLAAKNSLEEQVKKRAAELIAEITERRQIEEERDRFFMLSLDLLCLMGTDGYFKRLNPAWERTLGYSLDELLARPCLEFVHPDDHTATLTAAETLLLEGQLVAFENRCRCRDGSYKWLQWNAVPVLEQGLLYCTVRDITERKHYEVQLEYQANYDGLTQLPNRTLLQDRIHHALAHAQRAKRQVAVLFVDLDHFKRVNDSMGHAVGDTLLKAVAARLKASVRKGDTVARLGGDEFVIVLEGLPQDKLAGQVAHKVLKAMDTPFTVEDKEFFVTCSIGVSLFPKDGEDAQTLLKNANTALHRTKERSRNTIQFYAPEMNARAIERLRLENALRYALERKELTLHYQPQINLDSGQMSGVEALLRWQHPELGMISPAEFIPIAEETGLIIPMGHWVLKTACAQAKAWQDAGLPALTIGVNLSVRQFIQTNLTNQITQILSETGLQAPYLELEITESLLMQDIEGAIVTLRDLKAQGVKLAIDDFGTGYSSLNYLKRFPIDRLKIDRSFVRDITTDPNDAAITLAVIAMSHSLKLKVIAEGVETAAQLAYLRDKGCDAIQGHYFSYPLPAEEVTMLLHNQQMQLLLPQKIAYLGS